MKRTARVDCLNQTVGHRRRTVPGGNLIRSKTFQLYQEKSLALHSVASHLCWHECRGATGYSRFSPGTREWPPAINPAKDAKRRRIWPLTLPTTAFFLMLALWSPGVLHRRRSALPFLKGSLVSCTSSVRLCDKIALILLLWHRGSRKSFRVSWFRACWCAISCGLLLAHCTERGCVPSGVYLRQWYNGVDVLHRWLAEKFQFFPLGLENVKCDDLMSRLNNTAHYLGNAPPHVEILLWWRVSGKVSSALVFESSDST